MDAVEIARRRAAELHALAVSSGADPWKPIDVTARVARNLDIDVEPIAPGSPLLGGAHAHYDPSDDTIRYEDEGTDFHKGFLIAHELGHACLGDARTAHAAFNVDPARLAEEAPVGEDRVVDYSRLQRRGQCQVREQPGASPRTRVQ